ncbi:hypothetical protein CFP65_4939 [Kitasatospora sp. MMS16-BH015]|uniref:serine/threonine-protein kinase n=1 Tax=Kitasatospora sp. MMS16-BH015 TaxID=2018025 RepID=UPI000CA20370|nr:serine/threonine-protein kinase [Kitasatospora sp. MMS16-BH015]AUG79656.1 hypothetical protein CFP65_4939 [Kitasatospora sp. MMS16-BH015]
MRAGDVLDGTYLLIGEIGRGGFGVVWRAEDQALEREVAVKTISGRGGVEPKDIERFKSEARAVARLNHPNIVTLHTQGETVVAGASWHYLVMELVPGRSLAAEPAAGRPALPVALGRLAQVCAALAASHRAGVVHRDIKPENIMITEEGTVKVLDFGIARLAGATGSLTTVGSVIGSPHYLAPERWRGSPGDPAVDVYAVGCLLYELCTGKRAFAAGDVVEVMRRHVDGPVPRPRALVPELPEALDRLTARLLDKDPARRGSAAEVREELLALAAELSRPPVDLRARADAAWSLGTGGDPHAAVAELRSLIGEFAAEYGRADPRTLRTGQDLAVWLAAAGEPAAAVGLLRELGPLAPTGGPAAVLAADLAAELARLERGLPRGTAVPTGQYALLAAGGRGVKSAGA